MKKIKLSEIRSLPFPVFSAVIVALLGLGFGVLVYAQDLSDNETCMMCHAAFEFSCTDCHTDIIEIPHRAEVERGVDCLNCHEAVPEK
jgi:hypothetical protein